MVVIIGRVRFILPIDGYGNTTKILNYFFVKHAAWQSYMETATLFVTGFANHIPTGALLLVSDQPMIPDGVKTEEKDREVSNQFTELHLRIGIDSLRQLINNGLTVKHLIFDPD